MQLRKALKEYNDAIIQYCQISKLPTADPQELEKFQSWLSQPGLGGVYLLGRDRDVWSQGRDLMTLTLSPHTNRFSRFVANKAFPLYHRLRHSTAVCKASPPSQIEFLGYNAGLDGKDIRLSIQVAQFRHGHICRYWHRDIRRCSSHLGFGVHLYRHRLFTTYQLSFFT